MFLRSSFYFFSPSFLQLNLFWADLENGLVQVHNILWYSRPMFVDDLTNFCNIWEGKYIFCVFKGGEVSNSYYRSLWKNRKSHFLMPQTLTLLLMKFGIWG